MPAAFDPDSPVLAVDIGGTKLAAGVVTGDGRVHAARRAPTAMELGRAGGDAPDRMAGSATAMGPGTAGGNAPELASGEVAEDTGEALFVRLVGVIDAALASWDEGGGRAPALIGVGCGGPMHLPSGRVSPLNIPAWRAFPLRDRLAEHYERPTWIDNDAKALALGEGWKGAARGETDYLAMVVSTGVGAGIVVDGHLLDGATGNAGHLGHVVVVPDGRRCACGSRGCLEAEASGTAIAAITGRPATEADDAVRRRVGTLVGRGVAAATVLCDLRVACVAGSVALGYGEPFFAAANAELARLVTIAFGRGARIVPAGLGADGPLVGAAAVARTGALG